MLARAAGVEACPRACTRRVRVEQPVGDVGGRKVTQALASTGVVIVALAQVGAP